MCLFIGTMITHVYIMVAFWRFLVDAEKEELDAKEKEKLERIAKEKEELNTKEKGKQLNDPGM